MYDLQIIFPFFFFFADPCGLIPQSGIDLGPWQWKHQILTT